MTLSSMASGSAETALYSMRMALLDAPSSSLDQPLSKTVSNRSLPVGCCAFQFFPSSSTPGLAAIQEHGGEGPLLAVSVFFEHVGEPGGFDHGLVRVDRVGGALPCPGLGEFRPASFDGHGRCHVLEPVVGEPFPHARMFGLVDQVPEQSVDVVEFSSHVAGQVFVRGQRHPGVRIHNDEVAEFFNGFDVVPGVEQSSDEVEIHMSHTVEADGHRVDGFIHVFGHRRHGVTTLLESMSPLASNPLGPIFSKL